MLAPSPDTYVNTPPVPDTLPVVMFPVTASAPNVPTDVIYVCAAVPNEPFNVVAVTVGADKTLVSLSNVNVESAPKSPSSLKMISVFEPAGC